MFKWVLIFFCISGICQTINGQGTSFHINSGKFYIDGTNLEYKDVGPGDTLLFESGSREYLLIKNFSGSSEKPIVLINSGGDVVIDTDHYFGISIENCKYIKLTGTGDPHSFYGFKVKRVANGSGMGIGGQSSDFEIDHISIENCKVGGIYAKTDPNCSRTTVRGAFTQYNTSIHDNYVANAGNEGLYIGSTKYLGQTISCDGIDVLLLPSLLDGVKVYNNIIKYSGWDGIQVSSASKNCQIYNNTVLYDSQAEVGSQMSGIIIGGGSKCDCYNNLISNGKGDGIESHGLGGYRIFNNIILNPGKSFKSDDLSQMKFGIFVTDISVQNDSSFYIFHNNIINPKSDGIRFSSVKSKNNLISSNVIINPGNFDLYENGNTRFKGKDSYIMFQNSALNTVLQTNYLARNATNAGFSSQSLQSADDFKLVKGSPLIDAADSRSGLTFDFSGALRPVGLLSDIGAWEYNLASANGLEYIQPKSQTQLLGNPVHDFLTIRFQNESNQRVSLEIYNSNGQRIKCFDEFEIRIENQVIRANVSSLSSGLYFFRIHWKGTSESGKFLKN